MARKYYLIKEIFYWIVLVLLCPETLKAQQQNSGDFKSAFQVAEGIELVTLCTNWVGVQNVAKGPRTLNGSSQRSIRKELFSTNKSVKSIMTLSVPVCKNKKKSKMTLKGESMKVGNRRLGKSSYGAIALTIQL